ncbi:MAG: MotA/TolQ/ExbB proton channel family protein [Candidatus Eisenbacteria sp.]|nr:MotA/TolQ/ExbB proton channel family protein [Candidatus Eisenbacteria bacterium]
MDLATLIGIVAGMMLIGSAIGMGPAPVAFVNIPSVLIVVGGASAATLIRFPLKVVLTTFKVASNAFKDKVNTPFALIRKIVELAEKSRRDSLLSLENVPIDDAFLKKGIQLCVDGTEPEVLRDTLRTEMEGIVERHKLGQRIFKGIGDSAPAFGMIGTLIGLVNMLLMMEDPAAIGPQMAVALLTTLYGALIANLFAIPIADKLGERSTMELQNKEIVIHGIMGILAANHPKVVETRLVSYLEPKLREHAVAQKKRAA